VGGRRSDALFRKRLSREPGRGGRRAIPLAAEGEEGVSIVGFTWYSLTDQVDWDRTLREDAGRVNPLICSTLIERFVRWARRTAS
jgi:hypothetical protein